MECVNFSYLTQKQAIDKYPFLTKNVLKNLVFKNTDGFRTSVVKKLGRKILLDEKALLEFIANRPSYPSQINSSNLIKFTEWESHRSSPSLSTMRNILNQRAKNGATVFLRRFNRCFYIDLYEFDKWMKSQIEKNI